MNLGPGGDSTAVSSIITTPVLTASSVTEATTLLTVEPKVILFNWCIKCLGLVFFLIQVAIFLLFGSSL